nr:MAG TPA: hypothetical protein [Caudoviricetes sp.]
METTNQNNSDVVLESDYKMTLFVESLEKLTESLKQITDSDSTKFGDKADAIMNAMISLVPALMSELAPDKVEIDEVKANHIMKINALFVSIQNSLYKKREVENKEEVDLAHPKIQKAIEFIFDGVLESMTAVGISKDLQATFTHDFSLRMVDFENKMNRLLKGTSFQQLDSITNPLVKEFTDKRNS